MPKKRLSAIVDRAAWEKVTKGPAGTKWDSVVEKVWKDIGGNQEEVMSAGKFLKYKAEVEEMIERRERLAPRNKVESEKHLEMYGGLREGNRNDHVFARLNELRENAETAHSCRRPGPACKKKEVYQ